MSPGSADLANGMGNVGANERQWVLVNANPTVPEGSREDGTPETEDVGTQIDCISTRAVRTQVTWADFPSAAEELPEVNVEGLEPEPQGRSLIEQLQQAAGTDDQWRVLRRLSKELRPRSVLRRRNSTAGGELGSNSAAVDESEQLPPEDGNVEGRGRIRTATRAHARVGSEGPRAGYSTRLLLRYAMNQARKYLQRRRFVKARIFIDAADLLSTSEEAHACAHLILESLTGVSSDAHEERRE